MDKEERTNAMGLFSFAHSYWEAASVLQNTPRCATHPDSPRDYLYYHSIELYLKSYLRLKGYTLEKLRKIGHGIPSLHKEAISVGLSDDVQSHGIIASIGKNYLPARYIESGFFTRPRPEALWGVCYVLHAEIEPQVNAAFGVTRKRIIPYLLDHENE